MVESRRGGVESQSIVSNTKKIERNHQSIIKAERLDLYVNK